MPTLENAARSGRRTTGAPITGTGATLLAGSAIVTTRVVLAASPHASVTVSVTV